MFVSTPWRLAVTGAVGVLAGTALLSVGWSLPALAAFAGFALATRGALHLVTSAPFRGLAGAFAILEVGGDVGVGIAVLAWPEPTLRTLALLLGAWAVLHSIAGGAIAITTRAEHRSWPLFVVFAIVAATFGVILITGPNDSVEDAAMVIGLLALLEGARELCEAARRHHQERQLSSVASSPVLEVPGTD